MSEIPQDEVMAEMADDHVRLIEALSKAEAERDTYRSIVKGVHGALTEQESQARAERLEAALRKAGEWVAAVDPKLPMPGTGDSQQEVLDMIEAALAPAEEGK
jgi:hypothetical protein